MNQTAFGFKPGPAFSASDGEEKDNETLAREQAAESLTVSEDSEDV